MRSSEHSGLRSTPSHAWEKNGRDSHWGWGVKELIYLKLQRTMEERDVGEERSRTGERRGGKKGEKKGKESNMKKLISLGLSTVPTG